jgi:hypothetical protein
LSQQPHPLQSNPLQSLSHPSLVEGSVSVCAVFAQEE